MENLKMKTEPGYRTSEDRGQNKEYNVFLRQAGVKIRDLVREKVCERT
jgi:hypothetical protein